MRILILEDDLGRREVMLECLQDRFPQYPVEFFESAPLMIHHMEATGLEDVILIALDHDLIVDPDNPDHPSDLGDGVDVAKWLSAHSASCPVIVHTTNQLGGDRMVELLETANWVVERIVPYSDVDWIYERWRTIARQFIVHGPYVGGLLAQTSNPSAKILSGAPQQKVRE